MSPVLRSKSLWITLGVALLGVSFFAYKWLDKSDLVKSQLNEQKNRYLQLQDSIQTLHYSIRENPPVHIANLQKDRIKLFQSQAEGFREKIAQLSSKKVSPANNSKEPSTNLSFESIWSSKWVQIITYIIIALLLMLIILFVLISKFNRNKGKIKAQPKQKPSISESSSDLEELLNQLKDNGSIKAPIARQSRKQAPPKVSSLNTQTEQGETILNTQDEEPVSSYQLVNETPRTSTSEKNEKEVFGTQNKSTNPLAPNSTKQTQTEHKSIFPSSLNRFDREDKQKSDVLKLARRGYTSSEIARRLKVSQNQVDFIIKLQREKG